MLNHIINGIFIMGNFKSILETFYFGYVCWALVLSSPVTAVHSKTPLTKCCLNHQAYMAELDVCRDWKGSVTLSKMSAAPPVYSVERSAEPTPVRVESNSFQMTHRLKRCPEGYVGMSSTEFRFYEDGSIFSQDEHVTYQSGDFCIQESFPSGQLIARYCVRDPCNRTDTCIRKCCPTFKAFDISSTRCINYSSQLNVTLYNRTGYSLNLNSEEMFVRDGVAPQCKDGYKHKLLSQHDYHLRSNGLLFVFPRKRCSSQSQTDADLITDEYCVDYFMDVDGTSAQHALVCVAADETNPIYSIFLFISSFFLVATFAVYALIPEIRNIHGVVIMCYVVSRAAAYLIFGTLQLVGTTRSTVACRIMAILIHFSYISTYTWLNVVCFDIWWTLKSMQPCSSVNTAIRQNQLGKPFFAYSLYSWGLAAVIVTVGQVLDYYKTSEAVIRPEFGEDTCWFSSYGAMFAYVYGPVCVLIFVDIIFFVLTSILLRRAGIGSGNRHSREKYRLRVIFGLFVLKIVSWLAEFVAYAIGCLNEAAFVIDVIETSSSVLTFAIFVCKPNVWRLFKQKCPCLERLERARPYSASYGNRSSNQLTASTNISSREILHNDLIKTLSQRRESDKPV